MTGNPLRGHLPADGPAADSLGDTAQGAAAVVNTVGLHARPSVKLTQLAKTFACRVEIALSADGPWVDAKSPVKVMRVSAPQGAVLHVRSAGAGAVQAAEAVLSLIRDGFGEAAEPPHGAAHG